MEMAMVTVGTRNTSLDFKVALDRALARYVVPPSGEFGGESGDSARLKFFAANCDVWSHWESESYYSLDDGGNYGADRLDRLASEGYQVLVYCNPEHSSYEEFDAGFEFDEEHWCHWPSYKPGTLLEIVKRERPERIKLLDPEAPQHWSFLDPAARQAEIERQQRMVKEWRT
jgi:hypothetical protein